MRNFLLASIALLSINAYSQSYVILDNGIVVTTDKAGFTYDLGQFAFPQRVTLKGGKYFVEEGKILSTVDEKGFLHRKHEVLPAKILGKGINYFMSTEGDLYTIDKKGYVVISQHPELIGATKFGGNYFYVPFDAEKNTGDLYTVTQDGVLVKAVAETFNISEVVAFGGTYFMNNRGIIHTISADGVLAAKPEMRVGVLVKKGGNYFTDSSGGIFTVMEDGNVKLPGIPMTLKIGQITKLGSSYFLDLNGKLFVVDGNGDVFERTMADHDFRHARIISL
ncbi:MAG TPA: hypothetical protein VNJ08_15530 [Bacteriovoracaceae bacterium]|nr:hypothetical protein [Bacteriovoracaceae bacterium]